jgi:predicted PurR-regulated permease PerM
MTTVEAGEPTAIPRLARNKLAVPSLLSAEREQFCGEHGPHQMKRRVRMTTFDFFKRAVIVVLVLLVPLLIWLLFDVVLIIVGAILIAVLLRMTAEPFMRWFKLPEGIALVISGLIIFGVFGGTIYLFGTQIQSELQDVLSRADAGVKKITESLQASELGRFVLSHFQGGSFSITSIAGSAFSISLNFLEALVITLIAGFYFAAEPDLYRSGLDKFFPRRLRDEVDETTLDIAIGLRLWLIGQLIEMLVIGVLTTLAVWLIGLQSPLALGVIAGVAEFIPFLGPIIASIPALLVAATNGLDAALWTAAAYVLIHQLDSELVSPMIQRKMVYIPPAVMLLGIVAISSGFGTAALVFAAPIVVIIFVVVNKLYLRETLGEPVSLPGEKSI